MTKSPLPALMNCLRPSMNQQPSRCVAVVERLPTSEPASGSVIATAPLISPRASGGRYFSFCSSVPSRKIIAAGAVYAMPFWIIVLAHARASISITNAVTVKGSPLPPCSFGNERPMSPRSASPLMFACSGSLSETLPLSRITPSSST